MVKQKPCYSCGKILKPNNKFCTNCGSSIIEDNKKNELKKQKHDFIIGVCVGFFGVIIVIFSVLSYYYL